ncbi:hypothetical protein RRG08_018676 [Elysia crispata]|uniref:Uncharacterized protein n=1 Tax=Elysia crispata TaxID=231223 RepID=A0AAE1CPM4_9GAST|nr:hypothetical protein RRG08_018676 [Elysia crispata]
MDILQSSPLTSTWDATVPCYLGIGSEIVRNISNAESSHAVTKTSTTRAIIRVIREWPGQHVPVKSQVVWGRRVQRGNVRAACAKFLVIDWVNEPCKGWSSYDPSSKNRPGKAPTFDTRTSTVILKLESNPNGPDHWLYG